MDMKVVEQFYNRYHKMVKTHPNLYHNGKNLITLVLPLELIEYANSASGNSGQSTGARPVGIRVVVSDAPEAIKEIFQSPESLAIFIETSECDAIKMPTGSAAKLKPAKILMANPEFWNRYDKNVMADLKRKFDYDKLKAGYQSMTIDEFEQAFGLKQIA